ncbi:FAD-dependent oxidoreductase [Xanthobacteraceae bacterium Astr-EGSB]|uniref:dihydrolipoyl dehydrogenase family protein n=1 Tax=Astrobacterium formosum TaxID=3069710 RepID=UPI0027B65589|nr:FAD-dependent oxidoreductase [Xanthobacteraceae bacterium Astr-EGSB]
MPELLRPDICVIGAGSGGLSVAAAAAAFGVPVVVVEKGAMGGECLNTGCVPSKALLAAAGHAAAARTAARFGIGDGAPTIDFAKVRAHVRAVIAAIAPNDSIARFTGLGVKVIAGTARFAGPDTVAVGGRFIVKARRFVIATGSRPAVPAIPGLADVPFLTNETIFDLDECPRHLAVIGAGPVGLELAQAFRRLGAAVTVIEQAAPLAKDDPECAAVVLAALAREGVDLRFGQAVTSVSATADSIRLTIGDGEGAASILASHVLVAAGRRAQFADLDLERAGVRHGPEGIVVDRGLRTSNRRVYAIGDVIGGARFTHAANHQAGLVIRNALFRLPVRYDPDAVPWATYTDPELAQAGLTEAEARRRGHRIKVLRWPYHDNDRAQAEGETSGHIKVITTRHGRILGATIVGARAGELIALWGLAVSRRLPIRAVAGLVFAYPTLGEIGRRAAISSFLPGLTHPLVRRIITWMRRLG